MNMQDSILRSNEKYNSVNLGSYKLRTFEFDDYGNIQLSAKNS